MKIHELVDTSKRFYYEESLHSHIINDLSLSRKLLTDNRVSADRLSIKFQFVDQQNPSIKEVIKFYQNWLMYMEGESHKQIRNACLKYLNAVVKQYDFDNYIEKKAKLYFIENQKDSLDFFINDLVSSIMSEIIGIRQEDYVKLIEKSKDIVHFLYNPSATEEDSIRVLKAIDFAKELLKSVYNLDKYKENSILHEMKKANIFSLDIIINVLVDGHDPLCSALKTVSYNYFESEYNSEDNIKNSLKFYPPFTSCVRVATERIELSDEYTINSGDYILTVLPQQEGCPFNNHEEAIPFGYGGHTCLGKKLAEESLKGILYSFNKLNMRHQFRVSGHNINDSFGYYSFTNISLSKSQN